MRVLVTGGAGYIGSHFCKELSRTEHSHTVLDSLERGHFSAVQWGKLYHGNLLDAAFANATLKEYKPDIVVHFAGYIAVGESVLQPDLYYQNNVQATLNLLQAMQKHQVMQLVFSSSAAVYGTPKNPKPLTEADAIAPISPYGNNKAEVENILKESEIRSVSLRYFNAAGADKDGEIGEAHEPETHALPLMLEAIKGNGVFKVFGDDYATPDGTAIRDYVHVSDIARAHISAMDYLAGGGKTTAINLGTGQGTSVKELLHAAEEVTGKKVPAEISPRRAGDPPMLVADARLAKQILGWKPTESSLDNIVKTAWNWHSKDYNS